MNPFADIDLREAVYFFTLYSLLAGLCWAIWQVIRGVRGFFLMIKMMRIAIEKCQQDIRDMNTEHIRHQIRISEPPKPPPNSTPRISGYPPPLPTQTSTNWSDDDRETQVVGEKHE